MIQSNYHVYKWVRIMAIVINIGKRNSLHQGNDNSMIEFFSSHKSRISVAVSFSFALRGAADDRFTKIRNNSRGKT